MIYYYFIFSVFITFDKWTNRKLKKQTNDVFSLFLWRLKKKLDGIYTRMLRAILNKSWRQHPTRHQLYGHLPPSRKLYKLDEPDMQDTAGEARTNSSVMYSYGPPHMAKQNQDDQFEHTYSSYVRIQDVALKTCKKRWMMGRSGERGSGISVLAARHDDDNITPACLTKIWKNIFKKIKTSNVISAV